jgi:hypothetical protein
MFASHCPVWGQRFLFVNAGQLESCPCPIAGPAENDRSPEFPATKDDLTCLLLNTPSQFYLYRVFNYSTLARLYVLSGALSDVCELDPISYRASF